MPKAAGRSVAVCDTTSHREEAVADGVGRCLLFLESFVNPLCSNMFLIDCYIIDLSCRIMRLASPACPNVQMFKSQATRLPE